MSYNPYRKYCSAWWRYWRLLPGDIVDFIIRMYEYAPLLWGDRDWDYAYLLRMMKFKLSRMRKVLEDCSTYAPTNQDRAVEIHRAEIMLRNIVDGDPDDEWSQHYSQWHTRKELNDPCGSPDNECYKALEASHSRVERNWKLLWKWLERCMRGWWD